MTFRTSQLPTGSRIGSIVTVGNAQCNGKGCDSYKTIGLEVLQSDDDGEFERMCYAVCPTHLAEAINELFKVQWYDPE